MKPDLHFLNYGCSWLKSFAFLIVQMFQHAVNTTSAKKGYWKSLLAAKAELRMD